MQQENPSVSTDSSPSADAKLVRHRFFDELFKKFMRARSSDLVKPEVKEILETFVFEAFNESNLWFDHPELIKKSFSLLLEDLSETNLFVLHKGLATTMTYGIDSSVFDDLGDEPFFSDDSEEINFEPVSVINLAEMKELSGFLNQNEISEFTFENEKVKISLKKNENDIELVNKADLPFVVGLNHGLDVTAEDIAGFSNVLSWINQNPEIVTEELKSGATAISDELYRFMNVDTPDLLNGALRKLLSVVKKDAESKDSEE